MFPGRSRMRIDMEFIKDLQRGTGMTWKEYCLDVERVTGVPLPDVELMRRATRKRSIMRELTDHQLRAISTYHRFNARRLLTDRPEGPSRPSGYLYSLATRLANRYPEHELTVLRALFDALPTDLMAKLLPEVDLQDFE